LGQSVPNFWLGLMMMWLFAVNLGWLPTSGTGGYKNFIMPAITLGSFQIAAITRLVRSSMLETLDSEYVKLARIKGIAEWKVLWKHCLRNAALTPLTYFGIIAAITLTGSVTTETVFSWPGTGLLAFQSVLSRDFELIQALVLVFSGLFIFSSFCVDILYAYLDPRIRYS
jgi:peptide/nickel transport system permease protein